MRIAHISDIHIHNHRYHETYEKVFDNLYKDLIKKNIDIIILTGDIAHTKLQLSPAYFDMTHRFFSRLADIAHLYILPGNHDLNLKNKNKLDAITPVVNSLTDKSITYLKYSGNYRINDEVVLNVISVIDMKKPPPVEDNINICLFHGSLVGAKTDLGWSMKTGEITLPELKEYDYTLLGDIHKANQIMDKEGRIRYAGSLIQQNFGETNDKGYLIWDIKSKEEFSVEYIRIDNPHPFITSNIDDDSLIKTNARLRLVYQETFSKQEIANYLYDIKKKYSPISITLLKENTTNKNLEKDKVFSNNIRDVEYQNELFRKFLNKQASFKEIDEVCFLNKQIEQEIGLLEDSRDNICWTMEKFEWSNLFSYGEDNIIDMRNLSGMIGVFGKNYSGKSSFIDSILFCLYGSTSKKESTLADILNYSCKSGYARATISLNGKEYLIHRSLKAGIKKQKGEEIRTASSSLDLYENGVLINGETRVETDKIIQSIFGKKDDFLLTSFVAQMDENNFLSKTATKRKEILANFLQLEFFEIKLKRAKEVLSNIRGALKYLEGKDFDNRIFELKELIKVKNNEINSLQDNKNKLLEIFNDQKEEVGKLPEPLEVDIEKLRKKFFEAEEQHEKINKYISKTEPSLEAKTKVVEQYKQKLSKINIDEINNIIAEQKNIKSELEKARLKIKDTHSKLKRISDNISILDEVPCGDQFPTCKFIKKAFAEKVTLKEIQNSLKDLDEEKIIFDDTILESKIELKKNYFDIKEKIHTIETDVLREKINIEKKKSLLKEQKELSLSLGQKIKDYYNSNDEDIEKRRIELQKTISKIKQLIQKDNENLKKANKLLNKAEVELDILKKEKQEYTSLSQKKKIFDLYIKCVHSNGIPYQIVKNILPLINDEISKLLINIVDFEVFLEEKKGNISVIIQQPNAPSVPLEMGSGSEKAISLIALRIALISISNLPKSDLFILDEPATSLDEENIAKFSNVIDIIKDKYNKTFMISHMDSLKDMVDKILTVEKVNNFSTVS